MHPVAIMARIPGHDVLPLRTVAEVVVPPARVAPDFPPPLRAPLRLACKPPPHHALDKQPAPLPPPGFAPRKKDLPFPYALHGEPGQAEVGRVDVPAEGSEVGGEVDGVDFFDEDGEAHVAERDARDSSRGGEGWTAGCKFGNVRRRRWRGFFGFRCFSRWRARGARDCLLWPLWAPRRVGLGGHCNSARAPGLDMEGWMVLPDV